MPTLAEQLTWWVKQADHDLLVAQSNRANGFHDVCALMCQQSAEKFLKALFMKMNNATPPKIHQCERLAQIVGAPALVLDAARLIESDYIESRYPDAARGVPYERFTDSHSAVRLTALQEVRQWVLQQLNPTP